MFDEFKVLTRTEIVSRTEILLENYSKIINIEALTMIDMSRKQIIPAGLAFAKELTDSIVAKATAGVSSEAEKKLADKVSCLTNGILEATDVLDKALIDSKDITEAEANAKYFRETVFADMQALRALVDELETVTPETLWPFPTYTDLLFRV